MDVFAKLLLSNLVLMQFFLLSNIRFLRYTQGILSVYSTNGDTVNTALNSCVLFAHIESCFLPSLPSVQWFSYLRVLTVILHQVTNRYLPQPAELLLC